MQNIYYDPSTQKEKNTRRWFQNVKLVGELDEGTSIYIEDYAYTYLSQYANSDLSSERSAVLIGEYYEQSDQIVISGIMPIGPSLLDVNTKWLSKEVLKEIEEEKEHYFPQGQYVGWMHTQPGYGIMTTTYETAVHKEVFGDMGVLLLVDPIHNVRTFFDYKNNEFTQRQGFCMYYEKNEEMQRYMMDYPITEQVEQEENDSAVASFREMGARRKREALRKRKTSMVVSAAVATVLLTGAVITGVYEQQKKIDILEKDVINMHRQYSEMEYRLNGNPVEVVFTSSKPETENEVRDKAKDVPQVETKIQEQSEEGEKIQEAVKVKDTADSIGYDIHAVENGDSLLNISYMHYKTVKRAREIAELNKIDDLDSIYIGQKLKLPKDR